MQCINFLKVFRDQLKGFSNPCPTCSVLICSKFLWTLSFPIDCIKMFSHGLHPIHNCLSMLEVLLSYFILIFAFNFHFLLSAIRFIRFTFSCPWLHQDVFSWPANINHQSPRFPDLNNFCHTCILIICDLGWVDLKLRT